MQSDYFLSLWHRFNMCSIGSLLNTQKREIIIWVAIVAGLPCIVNYHKVIVGPMLPLVVLIHTRGQQGWGAAVPGRGCCHLLRSTSPPPALRLCGNQLCKGRATCQVTAGCDGVNKEWKPTLLHRLYFMGTQREVIGAPMNVAEWFPVWTGNYYTINRRKLIISIITYKPSM